MSNTTKILLALAIPIFILGIVFFLISIFGDGESEESEEEESTVQDYEEIIYSGEELEEPEESEEPEVDIHDEENIPSDSTLDSPKDIESGETDESLLAPPLKDIYGEEEVKQAKKTAEAFLESYYNFDGDNPKQSGEDAEEFVTEKMYITLINDPETPTHDNFKRVFKSAENHESQFVPKSADENMPLIYVVEGEWTDVTGENKRKVRNNFVISMKLEDGEYKVSNFGVDVPFN